MWDLVGNPEDRFSCVTAHVVPTQPPGGVNIDTRVGCRVWIIGCLFYPLIN